MKKPRRLNGPRTGGFTLTEIMVVIVIIGILAGLVLPSITLIKRHMYAAGTRFEISQLDSACRQFRMDTGVYPPDMYSTEAGGKRRTTPPTLNVDGVFGGDLTNSTAIPRASSYMKTYTPDTTPTATSSQLKSGLTSVCLVFWLGSTFTVAGKTYGPYYSFDPKQLASTAQSYTPGGNVDTVTVVSGVTRTKPWQVQGIDLTQLNLQKRVVPVTKALSAASQAAVPMYKYYDKFGVLKTNDPTNNKNYYIYDSYSPGGAEVNFVMHNVWEFDIFSYGADGLSALDTAAGSTTENQAVIDMLTTQGATVKYYLGAIGDDINNWSESVRARTLKTN